MASLAIRIAVLCLIFADKGEAWDYTGSEGPEHWHKTYPQCNGRRQSPIKLVQSEAKYQNFTPFKFTGYDTTKAGVSFDIKNNGHTVQITLKNETGMSVRAFGKTFRPWQLHFHWGSNNSVGSEHLMRYEGQDLHPAEMHFVHVNTAYKDTSEALTKHDGLMVFGTIFEINASGKNNTFLSKFQRHLKDIEHKNKHTSMAPFPLRDAFLVRTENFYHYNGSLTTPSCNEAVQWVVFTGEAFMSGAQMHELRQLKQNKASQNGSHVRYIVNNYRPVQARNGRNIYRSFEGSAANGMAVSLAGLFVSFATFLALSF